MEQVVGTLLALLVVFMVIAQKIRSRRMGPRVAWIPRSWRGRVNDRYESRGQRAPYDENLKARNFWANDDATNGQGDTRYRVLVWGATALAACLVLWSRFR